MKKIFSLGIVAVSLLVLASCSGTKFKIIPESQLNPGKDTYQGILGRLGAPDEDGIIIENGQTVKYLSYSYAKASVPGVFGAPIPNRTQVFYFHENILVGYVHSTTEGEANTGFDSSKVEKIKEGETTIGQVVALLGPPSGEYAYPLIADKESKAKVYYYVQMTAGIISNSSFQQILTVIYDANGIVKRLIFTETGKK